MPRIFPILCVAFMLLTCTAYAWQVDSNIVSSIDNPCNGISNGIFSTIPFITVADDETGTNKAVAYWSPVGPTMNVVYCYKSTSTGEWVHEVLATYVNNSETVTTVPGGISLRFAANGDPVIAYGYIRVVMGESGPTSIDNHIILNYKDSTAWQTSVDILNYTVTSTHFSEEVGFNPAPVLSLACASDGSIDLIYSYFDWPDTGKTFFTKAFHGNGPSTSSFATGTTTSIETATQANSVFYPGAPLFHYMLPSSAGPRVLTQKSTTPQDVNLTTVDYLANLTTETETELFPIIDEFQSQTGINIDTTAIDKIEDIIKTICNIQPNSSTSLTKLLTVAETSNMPIQTAIDNTGACLVSFIEPVTSCINISAEMEAVSPLWVKTPVVGPNGAYFATIFDSSKELTQLNLPVGLTAGSTTKLLVMKAIPINDDTTVSLLLGTKNNTYEWSWSSELPISVADKLSIYPKFAPHGSFALYSSPTGDLLAATP